MKPQLMDTVELENGRIGKVVGYDKGEYAIEIMDNAGGKFWAKTSDLVTDHDCKLSPDSGCTHWSHPEYE